MTFDPESPFELEALGAAAPSPSPWRAEGEDPAPTLEQLAPLDYARLALTAGREAVQRVGAALGFSAGASAAAPPGVAPPPAGAAPPPAGPSPGEARFHTRSPTVPGTTLEVAHTRAVLGDSGTTYSLTWSGLYESMTSGDPDARIFYCSALSIWTLAAAGYDVTKPLVGADGQPFTWTKGTTEVQVTLKAIIDGEPEAVEAMTLAERNRMIDGGSVGRLSGAGHTIGHGPGGAAVAVRGAAGAFRLAGIGTEVSELDQKPGDFAQSRRTTPKSAGAPLQYLGAGHAWQVWQVKARGSAMFGREGSPRALRSEALEGWHEGVELLIDKDTRPALVGPHTVLTAQRIEANESGAGTLKRSSAGGDGGVQITLEQPVPDRGLKTYTGYVVYYGRLGTSPWAGWKPATAATAAGEISEEAAWPPLRDWP